MPIYALSFQNLFTHATTTVRRYAQGSTWVDVTGNLNDLIYAHIAASGDGPGSLGWLVGDLLQTDDYRLFGLVSSEQGTWPPVVVELINGTWKIIYQEPEAGNWVLSGFFVLGSDIYVHGVGAFYQRLVLYQFHPATNALTQIASDSARVLHFDQVWPHGVVQSPTNKDHLILGDAFSDDWGWYEISTKTFHMGDNPGGSCIFAMVVDDDGIVWSGDYGQLYYRSLDGGHTFGPVESDIPILPEIWCFTRWHGDILGVGCAPAAVIKRTKAPGATASLAASWEVLGIVPGDPFVDGDGLQSTADAGSTLLIACGGEPYYYLRAGGNPTVYAWNGATLTDVGGGLDWGWGCYLLNGSGNDQYLRMTQRDDGIGVTGHARLDAGNSPSSIQRRLAPRIGTANTYS